MVYNYDPHTDDLEISPSIKLNGCTPLMHAILRDDKKLVEEILKNNPNTVNAQNNKGWKALHIVARNSKVWNLFKYLQLLLDNGADPNLRDIDGWTALMHAALYSKTDSSEETVKILLEHDADPNLQCNGGCTALMYAARNLKEYSSEETVRILLEYNANPNIQNIYGQTALMYAARNCKRDLSEEIVGILLEYKADPKIKDNDGDDVVKEIKMYMRNLKIRNREKRIEELEHENELLKLQPIPGINFINTFIEEFGDNDPDIKKKFIEGYIPILEKHLDRIIKK